MIIMRFLAFSLKKSYYLKYGKKSTVLYSLQVLFCYRSIFCTLMMTMQQQQQCQNFHNYFSFFCHEKKNRQANNFIIPCCSILFRKKWTLKNKTLFFSPVRCLDTSTMYTLTIKQMLENFLFLKSGQDIYPSVHPKFKELPVIMKAILHYNTL